MATEVELPQLGESVTEGIITTWLVEVGDEVEVDQPIAEISTDKVDTEIPSPVAGTITELKAEVDEEVEVGQVIAVVGEADEAPAGDDDTDETDDTDQDDDEEATDQDDSGDDGEDDEEEAAPAAEKSKDTGEDERQPTKAKPDSSGGGASAGSAGSKALTSPLVRKMLREADLSPDDVRGSGPGGRITREDAERAIEAGGEASDDTGAEAPADKQASGGGGAPQPGGVVPAPVVPAPSGRERPKPSPTQVDFDGEREITQDLSRIRKAIAKSMMDSLQSTAQLTAAVEVDLTAVMNLRNAVKDDFKQREGASLSPLAMIARAVCMTLPRHPLLNASIDTDEGTATFHRYINLGIAVDTPRGLLVPNLKNAQDLTVPGLARNIGDLAARTRDKKVQPDEISGGTFTITNTGSVGTLFDTPILNPPEVAILAACAIEKRPVVVSDAYGDSIAIRWMSYLCLTYDHRMVDGADAGRFLQDLKYVLETHDFSTELGQ